ncbi:glycosyltransferase family 69 protein [Venturia nashicola]|uniref:Glycosyltransferase family 69 protein n=1 Tax=Venturia nashicola TaxID=86259 RepID=A0A4Z1P230_9PEZI|nr:glycosyltransferase family 69 protein [Venturia nashicola]TLD35543.1 glycosyltransferase family 69 protein [Venturia nashicola]
MPRTRRTRQISEEQHPLVHTRDDSSDTSDSHELDDFDVEDAYKHAALSPSRSQRRRSQSLSTLISWPARSHSNRLRGPWRWIRLLKRCSIFLAILLLAYVLFTPILWPSYLRRPAHYSGRNEKGEKVFIAANIVDEGLIKGEWGKRVAELVELLGKDNVYLSVYENDSGQKTKDALQGLKARVDCNSSIVSGHIDLDHFPSIQILPNERRIKRIEYLSEVRNKAIEPLTSGSTGMHFDKILFINDVIFSPKDAVDLLFSTNVGSDGKTQYRAACAMDFINAFKFYDTFASRDAEGHGIGVPFYPWFTGAGAGISRKDVLQHRDAVRVKSCWGGMVAFEAKWFQGQHSPPHPKNKKDQDAVEKSKHVVKRIESQKEVGMVPLTFRASPELFWESSECCLIHADLAAMAALDSEIPKSRQDFDSGIYMNPYIRVAYSSESFAWLEFTRRFESLYTLPQSWINWLASRPPFQPRRTANAGDIVEHREWVYDGPEYKPEDIDDLEERGVDRPQDLIAKIQQNGHWTTKETKALPGGFCGGRQLLVLKKSWQPGERMWEKIAAPPGASDH